MLGCSPQGQWLRYIAFMRWTQPVLFSAFYTGSLCADLKHAQIDILGGCTFRLPSSLIGKPRSYLLASYRKG